MSNFVGKRPNPLAYAIQKISQKLSGQNKTTGKEVIKNINIAKDVTTKRAIQDKVVRAVDSAFKKAGAPPSIANQQKKSKLKRDEGKKLKGFSYKLDEIQDKIDKRNKASKKFFNKGGRVGLKKGSFPDFSGDGKTTMKDILMARGVIPKPKNKKMAKKSKSPMDKQVRKA